MEQDGRYVVCATQRPSPDDEIGTIITEMGTRVDALRRSSRPRGVTTGEVLDWARPAGFIGTVHWFERQWSSSPADELMAISLRTWPALRELHEDDIEVAIRPAIDNLQALPPTNVIRRATAEMVVLQRQ
jgi:hypothetical protein